MARPADNQTPDEAERRRRLTASELNRELLGIIGRPRDEHSTVRLTRNAKGDTQIEVSARTGENECTTIAEASAVAQGIYDALRAKYPLAGEGE